MSSKKNGFIVLDRKMLEWEWFSDESVLKLWILCLLKANWKDGRFKGMVVPRGSFLTSMKHLSEDANLSIMTCRRCIKCLEKTGEITHTSTNKYTLINVVKYDKYQSLEIISNKQNNNQPIHQPIHQPRHNRTINNHSNHKLDDDSGFISELYSVGFDQEMSVDEQSKLNELIDTYDYSNVISALKQTRKHQGKELAYTEKIIKNRKGYSRKFDAERDISRIEQIIIDSFLPSEISGPLVSAAEELKMFYTDKELIDALTNCSAYQVNSPDCFRKEIQTHYLEREDSSNG